MQEQEDHRAAVAASNRQLGGPTLDGRARDLGVVLSVELNEATAERTSLTTALGSRPRSAP